MKNILTISFNSTQTIRIYLVVVSIFIGMRLQADEPLPPAPFGFSWQHLAPIKSYLLRPDGWFFKQSSNTTAQGFYISRENVNLVGSFKTGLTLNCIRDVPDKTKLSPSKYAVELADVAASKFHLVERSSSLQGPFNAVRFRYVSTSTNQESITINQLLIANDKTGTLFIVIFESPTSEWEEARKKGDVILKKMLIDDET